MARIIASSAGLFQLENVFAGEFSFRQRDDHIKVNGRTLQDGVTEPFMYKTQIRASTKKVDRNAMFQDVKMSFVGRQLGLLPILFHQPVKPSASNGAALWSQEKYHGSVCS